MSNVVRLPSLPTLSGDDCRLLVESVIDYAIFMLETDGNVLTWNAGAERIIGFCADEIIGQNFSKFFTAEDIAANKPEMELAQAAKLGRVEDEGYRVRKDGSRFWANVVITALRDETGKLRGFGKVTRDLSARRVVEERLRQSEQRFHQLVDAVVDYAIFMLDETGHVATWNPGARRLKGYEADEIIGAHFSKFYTREDQEAGKPERVLDTVRREGRFEEEAWRVKKDGTLFFANVVINAARDEHGKLIGFVKITRDLTMRREAERAERYRQISEAVQRKERTERTLANATNALSSSLDQDVLLGAFAKALVPEVGDSVSVFVLEQGRLRDVTGGKTATQIHWNVVRSGKGEVGERSILVPILARQRLAGALAIERGATGRYDAEDTAVVHELARRAGIGIDNARLYALAQDAARRAEDASRAKDEFLATVSHELRTPLNAIVGWATILKQRQLDTETAKPVEVIHRNAIAQVKLVDDILDVSRVITGKFRLDPHPSDLVQVAREALEVVRPSAIAKKINLELELETHHCTLVMDPERMQQALWNLLSNAVKFTQAGGTITVAVCCGEIQARVIISDNGRGIDATFLPFVFEPFKQAEASITRRFGGLGLGLALVRHIVELHGGSVAATSEGLGKGSSFVISLPLRAEPRAESAKATGVLSDVRVLVVDDEPDARDLVAAVLTRAGADVETAESAAEGLVKVERLHPMVIISDIGMPVEDGYSFMRRVRAISSAPAMALTAFSSDADRSRAIDAGYTLHVAKPIDPEVLVTTIEKLARTPS